eukprot:1606739-Prymnesium_polylepis.1
MALTYQFARISKELKFWLSISLRGYSFAYRGQTHGQTAACMCAWKLCLGSRRWCGGRGRQKEDEHASRRSQEGDDELRFRWILGSHAVPQKASEMGEAEQPVGHVPLRWERTRDGT